MTAKAPGERFGPPDGRGSPHGTEGAGQEAEPLSHGPPGGAGEEIPAELVSLWEDLVTTLPSLPGR